MFLSEIVDLYGPKAEKVCLITSEEIEDILSNELDIKKADFDSKTWDEIISRSQKAVADNINISFLKNLIGNGLAEYVKEGPIENALP